MLVQSKPLLGAQLMSLPAELKLKQVVSPLMTGVQKHGVLGRMLLSRPFKNPEPAGKSLFESAYRDPCADQGTYSMWHWLTL